jgi:hypothetical protein
VTAQEGPGDGDLVLLPNDVREPHLLPEALGVSRPALAPQAGQILALGLGDYIVRQGSPEALFPKAATGLEDGDVAAAPEAEPDGGVGRRVDEGAKAALLLPLLKHRDIAVEPAAVGDEPRPDGREVSGCRDSDEGFCAFSHREPLLAKVQAGRCRSPVFAPLAHNPEPAA